MTPIKPLLLLLSTVMDTRDSVANSDVPVAILQRKIQSAKSPEQRKKLETELADLMQARESIRLSVRQIVEKSTDSEEQALRVQKAKFSDYASKMYREVVEYYKTKCFDWHEPKYQSALQQMYLLGNLCEENVPVERIKSAIDDVSGTLEKDDVSQDDN